MVLQLQTLSVFFTCQNIVFALGVEAPLQFLHLHISFICPTVHKMDVTEAIEAISQQLLLISPSQWIQIFFLLAAGGIVVLYALPRSVRDKLMEYGARADSSTSGDKDKTKAESTATAKILDGLVSISQVPHSWFWHFYLLSVACSAFWAWQFFTQGDVMKWIAEKEASLTDGSIRLKDAGYATSLGRILVAWTMMAMQGSRRLYECGFVLKPGKSRMLVVHWALGLLFYAFISVAIWVENSGKTHQDGAAFTN